MEPIEPPWQAIKEWIPDDEPTSTGSTVPGIQISLTKTGSTRRRHGKHLKSIWTTVASWFSNTPEDPCRLAENRRQKKSGQSGPQSYFRDK
jgi:hypothetical protein